MERRLSARKRIAVSVYLSWPGQPARRCKASNISTGGVFIEAESLRVPKGATVDLIFVLNRGAVIKIHRMPAFVARISRRGVGMMLYSNGRSHLSMNPPAVT